MYAPPVRRSSSKKRKSIEVDSRKVGAMLMLDRSREVNSIDSFSGQSALPTYIAQLQHELEVTKFEVDTLRAVIHSMLAKNGRRAGSPCQSFTTMGRTESISKGRMA